MQQPSNTVRTQPAPVNDSDNTVIELPESVTNHPAWRRIWAKLLAPRPAEQRADDEAA